MILDALELAKQQVRMFCVDVPTSDYCTFDTPNRVVLRKYLYVHLTIICSHQILYFCDLASVKLSDLLVSCEDIFQGNMFF